MKSRTCLRLEISKEHKKFESFLNKLKVRYTKTVKKQKIFNGVVYFIPNRRKAKRIIRGLIPSYAMVGHNEDYACGLEIKHRHVREENPSEAYSRYCKELDMQKVVDDIHYQLRAEFGFVCKVGDKILFTNNNIQEANVGVRLNEISKKLLKELINGHKKQGVELRGLFCERPDEIKVSVVCKVKKVGKFVRKDNHIFNIVLLGENREIWDLKDKIIGRYRELKFG